MSVVCNHVFTLLFSQQKHLLPLNCIAVLHINVIHSILKIKDLPSLILTNNLRVCSFSLHSCCHHGEPQVLATNFAHQNFRDSPQDAYCLMLFQKLPLTVQTMHLPSNDDLLFTWHQVIFEHAEVFRQCSFILSCSINSNCKFKKLSWDTVEQHHSIMVLNNRTIKLIGFTKKYTVHFNYRIY